jgi:hypothetical protein
MIDKPDSRKHFKWNWKTTSSLGMNEWNKYISEYLFGLNLGIFLKYNDSPNEEYENDSTEHNYTSVL